MHAAVLTDLKRWRRLGLAILLGHLILVAATRGIRLDHLAIDAIYAALMLYGGFPCRLALLSLPFWLVAVCYSDLLPWALEFRGPIHVGDLYDAERHWFGFNGSSGREIWPDFFREHHWTALDLLCGPVYLCVWIEMIPFALYLSLKDPARLSRLMWTYLAAHLAGFATWVLYPAAPPWYVELHGTGPAVLGTVSNAAGLARLDQILGIDLVQGLYGRSVNVFGAMPSLHIAAPTVFLCIAAGMGRTWIMGASLFAAIMAFSAVYFRHHYILDVLAGAGYACGAYATVVTVENWLFGSVGSTQAPLPEQIPCELST